MNRQKRSLWSERPFLLVLVFTLAGILFSQSLPARQPFSDRHRAPVEQQLVAPATQAVANERSALDLMLCDGRPDGRL